MKPDSEITKAILRLGSLCGMGNSESATEEFVTHLFNCASEVMDEIEDSHEQGLCLDAVRALSGRLEKTAAERIASLN
jgi:hypothetical protein